jgi:hypothetical protein
MYRIFLVSTWTKFMSFLAKGLFHELNLHNYACVYDAPRHNLVKGIGKFQKERSLLISHSETSFDFLRPLRKNNFFLYATVYCTERKM